MAMSAESPVVTIDGPSGAGKGTVSRAVATRLGWHYLDSGAIYRALSCSARRQDVELDDVETIAWLARHLDVSFKGDDDISVFLENKDITAEIQIEECGNYASRIAAYPEIRRALLERQREFQQAPGLVADGRDMGTVVFPSADFKIFLVASPEVRAQRRYKQLKGKGIDVRLEKITDEIMERDRRDRERRHAPLVRAEDAVLVDSSELSVSEVIERLILIVSGN